MSLIRIGCSAMLAIASLFAATAGRAATEPPGVARVSVVRGSVDVRHVDSGETTAATINAPLAVGDYLVTRDDGRAEVEFGFATALRLAPATNLRFVALDDGRHRVQLTSGTIELRVARSLRAHAEIETPQATIRPTERGRVRIAVARDGATTVTLRSGSADVVTDSGTHRVEAGSALAIAAGDASLRTVVAASEDDFDRWNDARDRTIARSADAGYVDEGMVGADDLSAYGRWIDSDRYGRVWSPNERPDWAPYHDGRFVYEPYYGYTWVGSEPWGWAPYHYGNWFYNAPSGWCWYPGAYAFDRPFVYRPAIVAFFSFGGGGANFGLGNIGWVPLAPYERFAPWYGSTNVTVINNTTNVTVVNAVPTTAQSGRVFTIYHNAGAPGGAVALDRRSFANGSFVKLQTVTPAMLGHAGAPRSVTPILPTTVVPRATAPTGIVPVPARNDRSGMRVPVAIDVMENRPSIVHPGTTGPSLVRVRPIESVRVLQSAPVVTPNVRTTHDEIPALPTRANPVERYERVRGERTRGEPEARRSSSGTSEQSTHATTTTMSASSAMTLTPATSIRR